MEELLLISKTIFGLCVCSAMPDSLPSHDCRVPGPSVHVILQARILEWVAISFSRGFFRPQN